MAPAPDMVNVLAVSESDYERLQARAADLGMGTAQYTALCFDFCECLPLQMLAAFAHGTVDIDAVDCG